MSDQVQAPSLPPVQIPDDLPIKQATSREALLARLHARTSTLSGQRARRQTRQQASIRQAAEQIGVGHAAPTANHILANHTPDQIADMIKLATTEGALPEHLARVVPPEVRNLSKKDLAKFIRNLQ